MKLIAATTDIFGPIASPNAIAKVDVAEGGLGNVLNLVFQILIVVAGIYAMINLVLAGYAFMSAGDDPKKVVGAWQKIWQTLLGLAVVAGSFVLAAIFSKLLFGEFETILIPVIPTL